MLAALPEATTRRITTSTTSTCSTTPPGTLGTVLEVTSSQASDRDGPDPDHDDDISHVNTQMIVLVVKQ